jgi:hypothetical protein
LPTVGKLRGDLGREELIDSSRVPNPVKEAEGIRIQGDVAEVMEERLRTRIKGREGWKGEPFNRRRIKGRERSRRDRYNGRRAMGAECG